MRGAVAGAILVVALLVPPASAAVERTFSSSSILVSGTAHLDGALEVLELPGHTFAGFAANTTLLQVRVETSSSLRSLGAHDHRFTEPALRSHRHGNATLTATAWQEGARLYAVPSGPGDARILLDADAMRITAPGAACHKQPHHFLGQQVDACRPLAGSQQVTDTGLQAAGTLAGNLKVTLWGWNVTVSHADGNTTYWSGHVERPAADGVPPGVVANSTSQVVTFWMAAGTVRLVGGLGEPVVLATKDLVLDGDGTTLFEDAGASGASLRIDGPLRARVESDGGLLVVDQGPTAAAAPDATAGVAWLALAAALGAVLLLMLVRRLRPATESRLAAALEASRHRRAASLALRLGGPRGQGVQVMRTIALLRAGHAAQAEAMARGMAAASDADVAAREYLLALARALQGDAQEAAAHLATAVRLAPEYRAEALLNSTLAPLLPPAGQAGDGYA